MLTATIRVIKKKKERVRRRGRERWREEREIRALIC